MIKRISDEGHIWQGIEREQRLNVHRRVEWKRPEKGVRFSAHGQFAHGSVMAARVFIVKDHGNAPVRNEGELDLSLCELGWPEALCRKFGMQILAIWADVVLVPRRPERITDGTPDDGKMIGLFYGRSAHGLFRHCHADLARTLREIGARGLERGKDRIDGRHRDRLSRFKPGNRNA